MLARFLLKLQATFFIFLAGHFYFIIGEGIFYSPATHPVNAPYSPIFIDSGRPIYLTIAAGHGSFSEPFLCLPSIIALIKVKRLLRSFKSLTEGILFYHIFPANFVPYFHIFTTKKERHFCPSYFYFI